MGQKYLIYLDVCCLNRPFDDQTQPRIKLETQAILEIISFCQSQQWELVNSTVLESEISQINNQTKKEQVEQYLLLAKQRILVTSEIIKKAQELTSLGIKNFDALHLACAENNADIFLTTDDRLLNKAVSYQDKINVTVPNPITWLINVTTNLTGCIDNDTN
jgi:predicted nucleic acid-binding protein